MNILNNKQQHLICKKCYDEEKINSSVLTFLNDENSSMFNLSNKNQSVYCKLCDQQHFLDNKKNKRKKDPDEKCCNKNCVLF